MRSPQTIGLECASPGTVIFQAILRRFSTSQDDGKCAVSATPSARSPLNDGQFCAPAETQNSSITSHFLASTAFSLLDARFHAKFLQLTSYARSSFCGGQ